MPERAMNELQPDQHVSRSHEGSLARRWSWSLVAAWRICSTQRYGPKFHGVCGGEPGPTGLHGQHRTMIRYGLHSRPTAVPSLICVPSLTCFHNLEVLAVTTRKEFNAPATRSGSRAHLSRHRCTSKSRQVTDLSGPKSESKKISSTEERLSVIFAAECYIFATHVVGKYPKCGACASGLCPREHVPLSNGFRS